MAVVGASIPPHRVHVTLSGLSPPPSPTRATSPHSPRNGVPLVCAQVAVSSGSACTSASLEPSYVLHALGVPEEHVCRRAATSHWVPFSCTQWAGRLVICMRCDERCGLWFGVRPFGVV